MAESSSPLLTLPTLTAISTDESEKESKDESSPLSPLQSSVMVVVPASRDLSESMVKLPMNLVNFFDVAKTWPKDSGMAMLIKSADSSSTGPQFVLAMELSMLGVIHGSTNVADALDSKVGDSADSSSSTSSSSPWAANYPSSTKRSELLTMRREKKPSLYTSDEVAMVGNYNRVYHSQLVAMLEQRKLLGKEPLPPVTIKDAADESGGHTPQLRSNMFFIVPAMNWTKVDVAVQRGLATLVALDRQDMDQWMRDNVVGVDVHCLKHYLGTMSLKYRDMLPQEFATWLDQAAVKAAMVKSKEEMLKASTSNKKRAIDALSSGDDGNGNYQLPADTKTSTDASTPSAIADDRSNSGGDESGEKDSKRFKS